MTMIIELECKGSSYLCPKAVELWGRVNHAYQMACMVRGTGEDSAEYWRAYDNARSEYTAHKKHIHKVSYGA